jgi:hypothetical protein
MKNSQSTAQACAAESNSNRLHLKEGQNRGSIIISKLLVRALFAGLLFSIVSSAVKRASDSTTDLTSPPLIPWAQYDAEPEKLGRLLLERTRGALAESQVDEIAEGFAYRRKENNVWVERFLDGYNLEPGSEAGSQGYSDCRYHP